MLILITENQLDEWVRGNAEDAQGVIVELIWRLVAASSPNPRERRFPLPDSVGQPGPDGILDAVIGLEPFVPEGRSLWEIGTGLKAGAKATSDYKDVTKAVPEDTRRDATFIFVTPLSGRREWPHTWKGNAQAAWVKKRLKLNEWKDVRVIEATKMIDWLHHFPAVEVWLAQKIRNLPSGQVEIPEQRWNDLRSIGEPLPLIVDIFLANREPACAKLKDVLADTVVQLKLATHYPDQVTDFVAAYVASLDIESQVDAATRCLIVSGVDAWNTVCSYKTKHILIADAALDLNGDAGTKLIQKARRAGHSVVFGGPQGGIPDPASAPLPMPRPNQLREALVKSGYGEERARTLAQRSDGNLASLLRCLQNLSLLPEWAETSGAAELAIAAILGSWCDKLDGDRAAVEGLAGKQYGEWIGTMREIALRPGTPLVQRDGNWKFIARYEGWYTLGPKLFDEHLNRLLDIAISVLREDDPQFALPPEERYAASIHGKVLTHSHLLRNGIAESLALVGSHSRALESCTFGKAESTAAIAVRKILAESDWVRWASVDNLLPLLSEAAPGEFLDAVERALHRNPCPFDALFAQEGRGITGGTNYLTGLLWALETLAWDGDYLVRVAICLAELAARDPGGQWANRPANSLTTVLLPWLPQTCASMSKRVAAARAVLVELPEVGWELLLGLLPQYHSVSFGTRKPAWRASIHDNWQQGVTNREYREQITAYSELAIGEARKDVSKLTALIEHLENLPQPAYDNLLQHLSSDPIAAMPEADRLRVWTGLVEFVTKHKKFPDAKWAMKPGEVEKLASIADRLAPDAPFYRHQRLFTDRDVDLFDDIEDYDGQQRKLDEARRSAIQEVARAGGVDAVIAFGKAVQSPWRVGIAFGAVAAETADASIVPALLECEEKPVAQLAGGFVWGRYRTRGWVWVDRIDTSQWTSAQIGALLSLLPFTHDTWLRSERLLGQDESAYWSKTGANAFETREHLEHAIDQLIEYGRPKAAIRCVYKMLHDKRPIDTQRAVRALLVAVRSSESAYVLDAYETVKVIEALQNEPSTNRDALLRVEWAYLPLLNEHNEGSPIFLERKLSQEARFFSELIRLVFRSRKEESEEARSEERKQTATNAYRLLTDWATPPGLLQDKTYDGHVLERWLQAVKKECAETGHLEVAMTMVGHVLVHVPADPDGLWIDRSAAAALNAKDGENIRIGFRTQLYNSRGAHFVDPTGKPEKELAGKYRAQAESVDNAGYPRLAATLREMAEEYEREAETLSSREPFEE